MTPPDVQAVVERNTSLGKTVLDQAVRWNPARWSAPQLRASVAIAAAHSSSCEGGGLLLKRRQVLAIASAATDPTVSFVAAMIWGHGLRGYGAWRVENILSSAGTSLSSKLDGISVAARKDAAAAWDAFTTTHKLDGLGPAFASKFAYFVAFADGPPTTLLPPLIVDRNTSRAMWDLVRLARSVGRRDAYLEYVRLAVGWSGSDSRADEIELALFEIGKRAPRT